MARFTEAELKEARRFIEERAARRQLTSWREASIHIGHTHKNSAQPLAKAVTERWYADDIAAHLPPLAAVCVRNSGWRVPGRDYWERVLYVTPELASNKAVKSVPAWAEAAWMQQVERVFQHYSYKSVV